MLEETINFLWDLVKWGFAAPILGYVFTLALVGILDSFEIEHSNHGKRKCWLYMTLFVLGFFVLLHIAP